VTSSAATTCEHWNVTGSWPSEQSNNYHVTFQLKQVGTKVTGTAVNPPSEAATLGYKTGPITGTVKGSHIVLTVRWMKSSVTGLTHIGHYPGTITSGHIAGNAASDLAFPGPTVSWAAHGPTRCLSVAPTSTSTSTSTSTPAPAPVANADFRGAWHVKPGCCNFTITSQNASGECTGTVGTPGYTILNCKVSGDTFVFTNVKSGTSYRSVNSGTISGNSLVAQFKNPNGAVFRYKATRAAAPAG
jgi:hypothetical protein